LREGRLEPVAAYDAPPEPALLEALDAYFRRQLEIDAAATELDALPAKLAENERWIDGAGRVFEPLLITGRRDGELFVAALAVLHYASDERLPVRRALLEAIGDALLAGDDVDPVTCVA
jgi:hypothetical protein